MVPELRKEEILKNVRMRKVSYIKDLAEELGISTSTVRRDIAILEQEGRVTTMRGGAVKCCEPEAEAPQELPEETPPCKEPETISQRAAALVEEGDSIYIDAGAAAAGMFPYLGGKGITIVSGSTGILSYLPIEGAKCIILGGEVRDGSGSVLGALTEKMISDLYFDKAFLEADGYSSDGGIYVRDDREARKKVIVKEHSGKTYVLMDEGKKNKYAFVKAFEVEEDELIVGKTE